MVIIKKFWWLILIGLLIRILIAGFTFHPDIRHPVLSAAVFFQSGSLDFYSLAPNLTNKEILDDLPLAYLINLPFYLIARPLVDFHFERVFLVDIVNSLGEVQLWTFLLYSKLPFIIFDIALAVLVALAVKPNNQKLALVLWLFNPITLWATAAIGQVDIQPTLFMLSAWLLVKYKKLEWAALSLGVGAAIKTIPLLLLPFIWGVARNRREVLKLTGLALIPLILSVLPFLGSSEFRQNALLAPQLSKSLFALLPLSGGEAIFLAPFFVFLLYLGFISKKRGYEELLCNIVALLLILLSLTHFHMQWFLWVTPFLLILFLEYRERLSILALSGLGVGFSMMLFLFEASLQVRLLAPLFPNLYYQPGLQEVILPSQLNFMRSIAATIFASSAFFTVWKLLKKEN
jgi:hypothetical protein